MTDVPLLPRPSGLRAWWLAARPATLWAAVAPVAVGTACAAAAGGVRWDAALAALVGAVFIQIGTNFANDLWDHRKGADGRDRIGPTRAVAAGWITEEGMWLGTWLAFAVAVAAGLWLTWIAGWPVVVIGVVSILSGLAYTAGPFPLAWVGLGDLFVFFFFGFVAVGGTAWVQVGRVPEIALWAAVTVGALATAILVVNNLRDVESDARAGKRTLVVRFGVAAGRVEYLVLMVLAFGAPVGAWLRGAAAAPVLLPLFLVAAAALQARAVWTSSGRQLGPYLGATARLLLWVSVLLSLGIVLGGR